MGRLVDYYRHTLLVFIEELARNRLGARTAVPTRSHPVVNLNLIAVKKKKKKKKRKKSGFIFTIKYFKNKCLDGLGELEEEFLAETGEDDRVEARDTRPRLVYRVIDPSD